MTKYYVQSSGKYLASRERINGERLLHRQVWVKHNGKIPKHHDIHHKDGDWRNNDISNLECISKTDHARDHLVERLNDPVQRQILDSGLAKAREAAKLWHSSPEGIEWHKANGEKTWASKSTYKVTCQKCGSEFDTYWPTKAKYCSKSCSSSVYFKTYNTDKRTCAYCGNEFMANRHRNSVCCSRTCSNRLRVSK